LNERVRLPRRFFLFFDLFFRSGRHNREFWKDATTLGNHRFGTKMLEAHITTTIRENYFRWMFQILSDPRCIPESDTAANFRTEYDFEEEEDFPKKLACSLLPLARLPKTCEIKYHHDPAAPAEEEQEQETRSEEETSEEEEEEETGGRTIIRGKFVILTEQTEATEYKAQQEKQRKLIILLASDHGKEHKHRLELMRSQVKLVRENYENLDSKGLKKAQADTKKKLRLYSNDEERPKKKSRKSGNRSRSSDKKIIIYDQHITKLDLEEIKGDREAWEEMYRKIMNKHVVENNNDEEEASTAVVKMATKWAKRAPLDDVSGWKEV
jgi:hypothetical protein